jgi:hypothetical protein
VTIIATPNRRFRDAALRAPKAARGRETETIPMVFAQGWILAERGDSRRAQLEQFVADVYAHAYRAELNEFPPMLAAITDPNDRPVGVIGARPAAEGPLFLEQYLDAPIECFVSARLATPIPRARIAEVGSLASTTPGFGKALMSSLAAYLDGAGFDVAVFTATRQLRNSIRKWNATTFDFGPANGDRLGEDRAHWGRVLRHRSACPGGPLEVVPRVRRRRCATVRDAAWRVAGRVVRRLRALPAGARIVTTSPLLERLDTMARMRPAAIALHDGAERSIAYAELPALVRTAAADWAATGARVGGLLTRNGLDAVLAWLGALAARIALVPLPPFFSATQLDAIAERAGIDVIVSDDPKRATSIAHVMTRTRTVVGLHAFLRTQPHAAPQLAPTARLITFTSGTTASPKGVLLSDGALVTVAESLGQRTALDTGRRHLCAMPLSVLLESTGGLLRCLLAGATAVVPDLPDIGMRSICDVDGPRLASSIARLGATDAILVPGVVAHPARRVRAHHHTGAVALPRRGWCSSATGKRTSARRNSGCRCSKATG